MSLWSMFRENCFDELATAAVAVFPTSYSEVFFPRPLEGMAAKMCAIYNRETVPALN